MMVPSDAQDAQPVGHTRLGVLALAFINTAPIHTCSKHGQFSKEPATDERAVYIYITATGMGQSQVLKIGAKPGTTCAQIGL